jgi:diguanylate cyclase (GGDEF)-like protein
VRAEIVRAAAAAVPSADGVLLFEHRAAVLTCVVADGRRFAHFDGCSFARDDRAALPVRALDAGHRVTLGDGARRLHPHDVAAIAVPLHAGDRAGCVLAVAARTPLDADDAERLAVLAGQSGPAYAVACEREADRRRADYDALTGLLTPAAFRQRLAQRCARARIVATERLALLFVDTDRFKEWNDAYGHAAGDALLRLLAGLLRESVRTADDLVARNGGDEFCLLLDGAGKADAVRCGDTLRRNIRGLDLAPLRPAGASALQISASIGVAAYPVDARDASTLLERADAAMYHSKRHGRDAVAYVDLDGSFSTLADSA